MLQLGGVYYIHPDDIPKLSDFPAKPPPTPRPTHLSKKLSEIICFEADLESCWCAIFFITQIKKRLRAHAARSIQTSNLPKFSLENKSPKPLEQ